MKQGTLYSKPMKGSLYRKVGIASLIMMSSVFLSRIIGLFRESVIAYVGGAGGQVDAYQLAFLIPEILNHVAATGFLSITFIPIFSGYLARNMEEEGWRVFSVIFTVFGFFLLLLILAGCFWTDTLVDFIAPGVKDPVVKALTVRMTRIVLPAQFFFFTGGLFMAVQFSRERFFIPALAPLLYNLGIIAGGLVLGPQIGIEGFAWGVLGGAFAGNFLMQWIGAGRIGMKFVLSVNVRHPDVRRYFFLTLPLILGLTMIFSTEVFFRFFGSYLPKGTVAALNYGLRIVFILVGLFGQAVGTATYPFMARLVAQGQMEEVKKLMNRTLSTLSLVIPFSALFIVLRHEVVFLLFQRGRFDAAATALTSNLLPYLLLGAFAFSAQTIVVRGYYAMQNTLFPALLGTAAVLLSIPVFLVGMDRFGAPGVALGVSFSAFLQVTLLYAIWNRRTKNRQSGVVYACVGKMILLSTFLSVVLEGLRRLVSSWVDTQTFFGALAVCMVAGLVFLSILYPAGKLLKLDDVLDLLRRPMKKRNENSRGE